MNYLSVCSGIEAATVAFHSLGWNPIAFSEIEPFPCKVLAHHYPNVPNWGDMTKFKEWLDANVDILVGGTPCQSFSVAGLRKGLNDPRGNLMLTYLGIANRYKPKWIVWENVPGVLSSNGGRDFGTFLEGLAQLGYGFAYRVLDAQFSRTHEHPRAVPQRRRRVFVVGCLGDWRSAAAVLFDSESLRGNPPPSRSKGQEVAGTIGARTSLGVGAQDAACGHILPVSTHRLVAFGEYSEDGSASTIKTRDYKDATDLVTFALAGNTIGRAPENGGNGTGYDDTGASYTLTKTDVHAVAFEPGFLKREGSHYYEEHTGTIRKEPGDNRMAVAYSLYGGNKRPDRPNGGFYANIEPTSKTLDSSSGLNPNCSQGGTAIHQQMRVRRLTPLECERLQGFPDNYTSIPSASNSARYKALGNSMAVNCMRILGERIAMVETIDVISDLI